VVKGVVRNPLHRPTVEANPIQLTHIRIKSRLAARSGEHNHPRLFIDGDKVTHQPLAARQRPHRAIRGVQRQMSPSRALRPPDCLTGRQHVHVRRLSLDGAVLKVRIAALLHQDLRRSGVDIHFIQPNCLVATFTADEVDAVAVGRPPHPPKRDGRPERNDDLRCGWPSALAGFDVDDNNFSGGFRTLADHRVVLAVKPRPTAAGRHRLHIVHQRQLALINPVRYQSAGIRRPRNRRRHLYTEQVERETVRAYIRLASEWYAMLNPADASSLFGQMPLQLSQDRFPYQYRGDQIHTGEIELFAILSPTGSSTPLTSINAYLTPQVPPTTANPPTPPQVDTATDLAALMPQPAMFGQAAPVLYGLMKEQQTTAVPYNWWLSIPAVNLAAITQQISDIYVVFHYSVMPG
jgi:hypothetical protein